MTPPSWWEALSDEDRAALKNAGRIALRVMQIEKEDEHALRAACGRN